MWVQGLDHNEGACGHVDAALLTHQQLLGRNSLGVRFTSLAEHTTSVPEEPEAIRRGLSALGEPHATGRPSRCFQGIAGKQEVPVLGFILPTPTVRRSPSRRRPRILDGAGVPAILLVPCGLRLRAQGTEFRLSLGARV